MPPRNRPPENNRAQSAEYLNEHLAVARSSLIQCPPGLADQTQPGFTAFSKLAVLDQAGREAFDQAPTCNDAAFNDLDAADWLTKISRGIDRPCRFTTSHAAPQ
jgi:hypothetical protein